MSYKAMDKVSEAQDVRTAKAICEGPDMTWTKAPNGWVCSTPSGGCYLVSNEGTGSCTCPDHTKRLAGTLTRCKHRVALAMRQAEEAMRQAPPVIADSEAQAARIAREDELFDRIFGRG